MVAIWTQAVLLYGVQEVDKIKYSLGRTMATMAGLAARVVVEVLTKAQKHRRRRKQAVERLDQQERREHLNLSSDVQHPDPTEANLTEDPEDTMANYGNYGRAEKQATEGSVRQERREHLNLSDVQHPDPTEANLTEDPDDTMANYGNNGGAEKQEMERSVQQERQEHLKLSDVQHHDPTDAKMKDDPDDTMANYVNFVEADKQAMERSVQQERREHFNLRDVQHREPTEANLKNDREDTAANYGNNGGTGEVIGESVVGTLEADLNYIRDRQGMVWLGESEDEMEELAGVLLDCDSDEEDFDEKAGPLGGQSLSPQGPGPLGGQSLSPRGPPPEEGAEEIETENVWRKKQELKYGENDWRARVGGWCEEDDEAELFWETVSEFEVQAAAKTKSRGWWLTRKFRLACETKGVGEVVFEEMMAEVTGSGIRVEGDWMKSDVENPGGTTLHGAELRRWLEEAEVE